MPGFQGGQLQTFCLQTWGSQAPSNQAVRGMGTSLLWRQVPEEDQKLPELPGGLDNLGGVLGGSHPWPLRPDPAILSIAQQGYGAVMGWEMKTSTMVPPWGTAGALKRGETWRVGTGVIPGWRA